MKKPGRLVAVAVLGRLMLREFSLSAESLQDLADLIQSSYLQLESVSPPSTGLLDIQGCYAPLLPLDVLQCSRQA